MAEEQHYLQQYQRGDMEAKTILIERNLRLVAHVVKKYQGADVELDDLISIGTIGLMKAISTFDPGKTTRLSTYAARSIDNELLMMFRTRKKHSREVSLYEPIGTDKEGNESSGRNGRSCRGCGGGIFHTGEHPPCAWLHENRSHGKRI